MKILRKGDEFIKMLDSTQNDLIKIQSMTEKGWEFAKKSDYKSFIKGETKPHDDKKIKNEKETKEPKNDVKKDKDEETKKDKIKDKKNKK